MYQPSILIPAALTAPSGVRSSFRTRFSGWGIRLSLHPRGIPRRCAPRNDDSTKEPAKTTNPPTRSSGGGSASVPV